MKVRLPLHAQPPSTLFKSRGSPAPQSPPRELIQFPPDHPQNFVDLSLETPDQQFATLVAMMQSADAASPAPYTSVTGWGESIDPSEITSEAVIEENYMPAPDLESSAAVTDIELRSRIEDAFPQDIPEWHWENDPQYYGLGVPPGVPNWGQPIESGHTQIVKNNPSAELGWDAWSGRPVLARVARHENDFKGYGAGTSRGHGVVPIKLYSPYVERSQLARQLMLAELNRRGVHNVVIADIPAIPYTEEVMVTDPAVLTPQPEIGPEGVLP